MIETDTLLPSGRGTSLPAAFGPLVILMTSSCSWVGTLIPTWRRNTTTTQKDCVWSSTSGSLSYIKLPPALSSFAARSLYNSGIIPSLQTRTSGKLLTVSYLADLTALAITQCIKSTDYMFWSFSTYEYLLGAFEDALVQCLSQTLFC